MNDNELLAIEARANAATEGPWRWDDGDAPYWAVLSEGAWVDMDRDWAPADDTSENVEMALIGNDMTEDDARFIAAARSDILVLIAEVRRLTQMLREAR